MAAACIEIFKTLNNRNFYIYWCINLKLAEIFQNWGYLHCVKILSKKSLIQIFDYVIVNYQYSILLIAYITPDVFQFILKLN